MEDWASWEELKANEGSNSASNYACGNWAVRARLALGTRVAVAPEHRDRAAARPSVGRDGHGQDPLHMSLSCQRSEEELSPSATTPGLIVLLCPCPVSRRLLPSFPRDRWAALLWIGLLLLFFQELGVINQGR